MRDAVITDALFVHPPTVLAIAALRLVSTNLLAGHITANDAPHAISHPPSEQKLEQLQMLATAAPDFLRGFVESGLGRTDAGLIPGPVGRDEYQLPGEKVVRGGGGEEEAGEASPEDVAACQAAVEDTVSMVQALEQVCG